MKTLLLRTLVLAAALTVCIGASAEIRLPKIIGDNMVLQQGKNLPVWGYAEPGSAVTVKFGGQTKRTQTGSDGKWNLELSPLAASSTPREMTIQDSKSRVILKNILVGEVWLGSGQSNMEYPMYTGYRKPRKGPNFQEIEYYTATNPLIRIFHVERKLDTPDLPTKGWEMLGRESLAPFSAPAYFFAKNLQEELGVPVGMIHSSWGGTLIEVWTPEQAYLASPLFADEISGGRLDGNTVGRQYEKMIEPMIPFALRGFIWYQGESNLMQGDIMSYPDKQKVMVDWWRKAWGDVALPFYYVQIAPHTYSEHRGDRIANTWEALPYFWEAQTLAMDIPHTGMVVTTDLVDDASDIHPPYKWEVGRRLALWALSQTYGKELVYSGPAYKGMKIDGDRIIVEFDHTGSGLASSDGKAPDWFQVAGADGRFTNATAGIVGNTVVVSSPRVKDPVNVRFAWDELAMPNLMNKEGLPALPFRSGGESWSY